MIAEKGSAGAPGAALEVCGVGVGVGGELGEDGVEEGGLGDGDVALARDVDAGDALPISFRPRLLVQAIARLVAVVTGGHALVRSPRTGVGAEGLELDGRELGGPARGRADRGGGGPGGGTAGRRRRSGGGERRGAGWAGAQEQHRGAGIGGGHCLPACLVG